MIAANRRLSLDTRKTGHNLSFIMLVAFMLAMLVLCKSVSAVGTGSVSLVAIPPLENPRSYVVSDTRIVLYYDLGGNRPCTIACSVSTDSPIPFSLSGDTGTSVRPGIRRRIVVEFESPLSFEENVTITLGPSSVAAEPSDVNARDRNESAPPIRVLRMEGPVKLDGYSDESGWKLATSLPTVMQVPLFGAVPSERTEILIAYDTDYLYVAGRMYDRESSGVQATTFKRDDRSDSSDSFGIIVDTFNDNENALAFITTPTGSRIDMTITKNLQQGGTNTSWNTFWDVAVARNGEGWFVEMRIPFSSLRFQEREGTVSMGMSAFRWIARKDERVVFPDIPINWGTSSYMKPSQCRTIVFEGLTSSNPFYVTPYVLGGRGSSWNLNGDETAYEQTDNDVTEAGFDAKYSLTSNLTLDVTVNTDFAQVEADNQQVNLTRFPLFFPEKRLFFLERASNFEFNFYRRNSLFHSRTIGIHKGTLVPILGGGRLVGRIGSWDVGLLTMQTDKVADLSSENFGVVRLRRQVLNPYSYVGGIVTSRMGTDGTYNRAYGLDGIIRLFGDDYLMLNWAQTFENDAENDPASLDQSKLRAHIERYRISGWSYGFNYSRTGEDYNPGLGFEQYQGTASYIHFLRFGWSPKNPSSPFLQQQVFEDVWLHVRNSDNVAKTCLIRGGWFASTKSGFGGNFLFGFNHENVDDALDFSSDASVPSGKYEFFDCSASFSTPGGRLLRLNTSLNAGSFYDGNRLSVSLSPSRNISSHVEMSSTYQFDKVDFGNRSQQFTAHIGRLHLLTMLSVKWTMTSFIQYSSASEKALANVRLRYNPREGTDLYVVYNEGFNADRYRTNPILPVSSNRTIMLKYSHTFIH